MNKTKLLTFAVVLLLIINLATLALTLKKGPRHPHGGPKMRIIEQLHFNTQQQAQYEKLIRWHRNHIDALDVKIIQTKKLLYSQLLQKQADLKTRDSLISAIAEYQMQIEAIHFKHFQDIQSICEPEQLQYYNELTEELAQLFSKPPRPRHD
ncbi:hypothetical protein G4D82_06695 [Flavobacterium sp. CYK-4]|uniref:hypothetical protein n=1 Tax=Flavobacterium lotistagni TaxID=2709660 RepID=UPI00140DD3D4|nr:hypothetical protein [Flavobacterium lotistagni]NHM06903.1 hypothetical protein [Flavobacterium lotistagni]